MKTRSIMAFCVAMSGFAACAATTITIDNVRQRWPWNNKVDITYTIGGDDATVDKVCRVVITSVVGGVTYTAYDGAPNANVLPGTHTVTWGNPPANVKCDDCKMTAKFYTIPVPSGNDYMIVDLTTGAVSYEGLFANGDSFGGVSGQNLSNARYNVDKFKKTHYVLRKVPKGTYKTGDSVAYPSGNGLNNDATWTTDKVYYIGVFPWTSYQYWRLFDPDNVESHGANQIALCPRPLGLVRDIRGSADVTNQVVGTTASDFKKVIPWLNGKTGMSFDLPTELMYEIAARAGTTTKYFWGDDANDAPKYAVYGRSGTRPNIGWEVVGTKLPNNWGLYDMVGNDWEWCLDSYVAGDDPATHTDVFTPYFSDGAIQLRVRANDAKGNAAGMNPACRSGASYGDLNNAPQQYVFRVAYIVPNPGE